MLPGISLTSLLLLLLLLLLLNSDVACFTTHKFNLSYNKSGCCRLSTHFVAESREHIGVHFTTKSVHFAHFVGSKQTCFEASDVTPMFDVNPA